MTDKIDDTATDLRDATKGFDALFANDLEAAVGIFSPEKSPFHALGAGVCSFLEAALGMEVGRLALPCCSRVTSHIPLGRNHGYRDEAISRSGRRSEETHEISEVITVNNTISRRDRVGVVAFRRGDTARADARIEVRIAVYLHYITSDELCRYSESYMGYLQCFYELNR